MISNGGIAAYRKRKLKQSPKERRLYKRYEKELAELVTNFFQKSMWEDEDTVKKNFLAFNRAWRRTVGTVNHGKKPIFLMIDGFEEAIQRGAYNKVMNAHVNDKHKNELIRIVQLVEEKDGWKLFMRKVKRFFLEHFFVVKEEGAAYG